MKVHIDFSVFCPESFGRVSGELEIAPFAVVGATIVLSSPIRKTSPHGVADFSGHFEIERVLLFPQDLSIERQDLKILLMLSDLNVGSKTDAEKLMVFFETGFGLFGDRFDELDET